MRPNTVFLAGGVLGVAFGLGLLVNSLGWSTVLIYALLLLGYLGCMRARTAVA